MRKATAPSSHDQNLASSHLSGWEESGPEAGREEDTNLLSFGYHLAGDCCIHLQMLPGLDKLPQLRWR